MPSIKLDKIGFDSSIYPREKWKSSTVSKYVDDLKAGDRFPSIVLEKETNRLLDGMHRWKAYQKYLEEYQQAKLQPELNGAFQDEWAEPQEEVEVEYRVVPDGIPAKLYAASLSAKHGDRISAAERKEIAREIYESDPDFTLKVLSEYLGGSISTNHGYVADLLASRKELQKMVVFRLTLLGWVTREIAEIIGVSPQTITNFCQEFSDLKNLTKSLLSEGHPHTEIADRHNMPLQLVWAIDLEGRTDAQRFEKLRIGNPQPYDVWSFGKCHDLFGNAHPGRIPGQLIAHVLYFFTKPGDMVIDPMAGSGTTTDVCLTMGRKCYAYDIDLRHERTDIIKHNLTETDEETKLYWPNRIKKANLIFWDPPYFEKMDSQNIGGEGYIEGSISKLGREGYLSFIANRLTEAKELVKRGTKLAFLMSDWDDETEQREGIFIWDYANIITRAGWKLKRHIQVPLPTQQVHPDIVMKFRKSRRLARLERYLLIAEAA